MIYLINTETKEHRVYKPGDVVDSRIWKIVEADADGWIEWAGESDSSPVPRVTLCRIKLSDGCELEIMAPEEWSWSRGGDQHIIAYRPILSEPEAPEWDGEGLPPVGVECEYRDASIPSNPNDWRECMLLARFGEWLCVVEHKHGDPLPHIRSVGETKFRPLRTAAQRAEEEVVEAICRAFYGPEDKTLGEYAKDIYAAIRDGEIPGVRLTGNPRR